MLSCILTTAHEPGTVGAALGALIHQEWPEPYEVLAVCPDDATAAVIQSIASTNPSVRLLRDRGEGKPAALNLAIDEARGAICVFTDGDVVIEQGAVAALIEPFGDPWCGAVSGRPVSVNPTRTMLGYWSHLLTDAGAHALRARRSAEGGYLDCSGYLFAVRRELLQGVPSNTLAEDAYISQRVHERGYRIVYAPGARVAVRYPTTYSDWILQKRRSTAGAAVAAGMRSLSREVSLGIGPMLRYPRTIPQYWWMLCLLVARAHLWLLVWIELRVRRRRHSEIWRRVESTK